MQNVGSEIVGIFAQFPFAQFAMVVAVEEFVHAALVFDRFQCRLIEQDNDGLLRFFVVAVR